MTHISPWEEDKDVAKELIIFRKNGCHRNFTQIHVQSALESLPPVHFAFWY
jgi:hypothetical protein